MHQKSFGGVPLPGPCGSLQHSPDLELDLLGRGGQGEGRKGKVRGGNGWSDRPHSDFLKSVPVLWSKGHKRDY